MNYMRWLFGLLLLFNLSASLSAKEPLKVKELLDKVLDRLAKSNTDTNYVVRQPFRFSIKPRLGTSFGFFNFEWMEDGKKKEFTLYSEPIWKAGASFSYRNLTIGFQRDISHFLGGIKNDESEYGATAYGSKLGGEFYYSASSRYSIEDKRGDTWRADLKYLRAERLQANGYYVFNSRHFSYPAAFTQSFRQKRSGGSFIVGLSLNHESLKFDLSKVPEEIANRVDASVYPQQISYSNFNVNGGYAYNWVVTKQWMLHGSLIPSVSIVKKAKMRFDDHDTELSMEKVDIGCIFRMGVLWDGLRNFGGFTAVATYNSLGHRPVDISSVYVRTRLFYGFRF